MKKALMLLCILMCSLAASAQDLIVKKDGNAMTCRVVVVLEKEVVYKKWTELQTDRSYTMGLSDISAILYEDGKVQRFDGVAAPAQSPVVTNSGSKDLDDAALLRLANAKDRDPLLKKAAKLKKKGLVYGGALLAVGLPCLLVGTIRIDDFDEGAVLGGIGGGLTAGGLIVGGAYLAKASKLKRQAAMPTVYSAPVLQNEFALKNGTTLAPSLNTFSDNVFRTPAVGLGLSYNF